MSSEWEEIERHWEGDPNLCRVCGTNDPGNCRGRFCLPAAWLNRLVDVMSFPRD